MCDSANWDETEMMKWFNRRGKVLVFEHSLSFAPILAHHYCMKLAHSLGIVVAIAALSGFKSDDTFSLKQTYKKDDVAIFMQSLHISAEDSEVEMEMKTQDKVLNVADDGAYEIEETLLSGTFKFNGEEQAMEKREPKSSKYDKEGKKVKIEGENDEQNDPIALVIEDVFDYEPKAAVKVGETWKHEGDYGTMTLTLEAKEKVGDIDCLKVTVKGKLDKKDTSVDVSATFYIRESDFSPEKMEGKIENPKLDADSPAMKKIEIKMNRVKE